MKKLFVFLLCVILAIGSVSSLSFAAFADDSSDYKIVGSEDSGDYIISNVNVADYGAKGDGITDDTAAIKSALSKAATQGGGVVYMPAGEYIITSPLTVGNYVTLIGVWNESGDYDDQTVLVCDYDGSASTKYFITLLGTAAVKNLNIYYKRQNAKNPVEYPFTIGTDEPGTTAKNITLLNSYNGIYVTTASFVENIYATCFNKGFENRKNYEISDFVNLNFSGKYLRDYDGTSKSDIKKGTKNCKAVIIGKCDDLFLYGVNIDDAYYNNTIYVELDEAIPVAPKQAYGHVFQINGADVVITDAKYYVKLSVEDEIDGVTKYSHQLSQGRYPVSNSLFVVTKYGAVGNGIADDTQAVKDALAAAQQAGGGTVYFPVGNYKISDKITVPENVEMRGAWDSPMYRSNSVIRFYTDLSEKDAMITLSANSGIHGFAFRIPDYSYDELQTSKYPWIIRGNGNGVWVENVTFINTYNGVDFSTNRCDNFLLKGVWGTCMNQAFVIGGGSTNGIIEYVFTTYGTWWEDTIRATDKIENYTYENTVALTIGDAKNIAAFSVGAFGIKTALSLIEEDGKGVENLRIIRLAADLPRGNNNLEIRAGNNIAVIGLSTGGGVVGSKYVKIYPTFAGTMRVYGQIVWSNASGTVIYSDYDYKSYNEISEDVDILTFNFEWEKSESRGCGSVVSFCSIALALVVTGVSGLLLKKRKFTTQN